MTHPFDFLNNLLCIYCHTDLVFDKIFRNTHSASRFNCPNECMRVWMSSDCGCWTLASISLEYNYWISCFRHEKNQLVIQCHPSDLTHYFDPITIPLFDIFRYSRPQLLEKTKLYLLCL